MTPSLAAALERSKVTDCKATIILAEAAQCFGQHEDELSTDVPLSVHWDGKLMQDPTTQKHVESASY